MLTLGLIGDGNIARRHHYAIERLDGVVRWTYDPKYAGHDEDKLREYLLYKPADVIAICSPTCEHRKQIDLVLKETTAVPVICEKPPSLPWETLPDHPRLNHCLPLRYYDKYPKTISKVTCNVWRDPTYYESWRGDITKTGGVFYHMFIHYIDLAMRYKARFHGMMTVGTTPNFEAMADKTDLREIDLNEMYVRLYQDVLDDGGIKTDDIRYLMWNLDQLGMKYGHGPTVGGVNVLFA